MKTLATALAALSDARRLLTARALYRLDLTEQEYKALEVLAARGYDGGLLEYASDIEPSGNGFLLHFRESDAWNVSQQYNDDPDAYGAMANSSLRRKMFDFVDSIV